jgi:hypothetical protein
MRDVLAIRPDQFDHPPAKQAQRADTNLPVSLPLIFPTINGIIKDFLDIREVNIMIFDIKETLGFVVCDHYLIVARFGNDTNALAGYCHFLSVLFLVRETVVCHRFFRFSLPSSLTPAPSPASGRGELLPFAPLAGRRWPKAG